MYHDVYDGMNPHNILNTGLQYTLSGNLAAANAALIVLHGRTLSEAELSLHKLLVDQITALRKKPLDKYKIVLRDKSEAEERVYRINTQDEPTALIWSDTMCKKLGKGFKIDVC